MVDGVYDKDPHKYDDAKKYDTLTFSEVLSNELAVMDSTAATMCRDNDMSLLVFDLSRPDNIYDAVMGENIGTIIKEN
jgi:uridylate kinase